MYLRESDSYDILGQWFLTGGQVFPEGGVRKRPEGAQAFTHFTTWKVWSRNFPINTFDFTTYLISDLESMDNYGKRGRKMWRTTVLGHWESELLFPYLKAAARELLGMTTTSAPWEQSLAMQANCTAGNAPILAYRLRIFGIHNLMRMNPHLDMNWTWIKVALIHVNVTLILVQLLVSKFR